MIAAIALCLAVALDRAFGEPPNALHPVAWMGAAIARGRDFAMRASSLGQLARGTLLALAIPTLSAAVAWALVRAGARWTLVSLLVTTALLKPLFAIRALREAAFAVREALARDDLPGARVALGSLCSRDARALDAPELIAATVESLAENASDSIVAPLFWFAVAGAPGAAFYRAANTLDAMIGYHGRFEWAGKASARLDDALNLVPARVTAMLMLVVAPLAGGDVARGASTWLRDGARTESPNAGRPMATMAGLLGVRLEKPGHYALGEATRALAEDDITRAWRIVSSVAHVSAALAATALVALARVHG